MLCQILYLSLELVLVGRVKPRKEIAEDVDLRESARRRSSVCLYILAFYRIAGLSKRHLKL